MASHHQHWSLRKVTRSKLIPNSETGMISILIEDCIIISLDLVNTIYLNLFSLRKSIFHQSKILQGIQLGYQSMQTTDIIQKITLNSLVDQVLRQRNTSHHTRAQNHLIQDLPSVNLKDFTSQVVWLNCKLNCKLLSLYYSLNLFL